MLDITYWRLVFDSQAFGCKFEFWFLYSTYRQIYINVYVFMHVYVYILISFDKFSFKFSF